MHAMFSPSLSARSLQWKIYSGRYVCIVARVFLQQLVTHCSVISHWGIIRYNITYIRERLCQPKKFCLQVKFFRMKFVCFVGIVGLISAEQVAKYPPGCTAPKFPDPKLCKDLQWDLGYPLKFKRKLIPVQFTVKRPKMNVHLKDPIQSQENRFTLKMPKISASICLIPTLLSLSKMYALKRLLYSYPGFFSI